MWPMLHALKVLHHTLMLLLRMLCELLKLLLLALQHFLLLALLLLLKAVWIHNDAKSPQTGIIPLPRRVKCATLLACRRVSLLSQKDEAMSIADASAVVNWEALTDEAVRHLGALLRFDTTNPPGNEIIAAMYIRDQLAAEGIETRIVEPAQGRGNVWARLAGNGNGRPLMLLSHLDVVPVERNQWTVDPFGGEIHDG